MKLLSLITAALTLSATAFAAKTEVAIGLASNFSEVSSSSSNPFGGYFRDGVTLALEKAKPLLDKRGIALKVEEFDYGISDAKVLEAAQKAAASNVVAVLGYNFSSHALLAAPIHQKFELPMLTPSATANRIASLGSYIHQGCFDNDFMGETLARVAINRLKAKSAAIVAAADCAYCTDLARAFETEFKKSGGTISVSVPLLQDDKNLQPVIDQLKGKNFDVILVPNQELSSARVISAILNAGINKPFLGGDGWGNVGQEFFGILKNQKLTGYSVSHWHPDAKSKLSKEFVAAYQKSFGKTPNDTSVLAYDSTALLVDVVLRASTFTRKGIEDAFNKTKTFSGVTGKFVFQPKRAPLKSLVLLEANSSKFKVLEIIDPPAGGRQ